MKVTDPDGHILRFGSEPGEDVPFADQGDQARALANVSRALKPGAPFLFTFGDRDGSVECEMNGVPFRYFSLSVEGYRSLLNEHGFQLIESHADAGENCYYLARKVT